MKANNLFNSLRIVVLIIASGLVAGSCQNNTSKTSDASTQQATKENDIKFENKKLEKDAQFLVDATSFNLEMIKLSELAKQKGSLEVQKLDNMLAEKHAKSLKEVRGLADKKQVSIPDSATSEGYQTLSAKTGNDFDKAYCDRLIEGHKKAVASFEKEAADSRDQDIKEWASKKLPELREHLDNIFECQKKCEKM